MKDRMGDELAKQYQRILDERTWYIMWVFDVNYVNYNTNGCMIGNPLDLNWYFGNKWQERSSTLFELAREVVRAIGK